MVTCSIKVNYSILVHNDTVLNTIRQGDDAETGCRMRRPSVCSIKSFRAGLRLDFRFEGSLEIAVEVQLTSSFTPTTARLVDIHIGVRKD